MPFPRVLADGRVEVSSPRTEARSAVRIDDELLEIPGFDPFKLIIRIMSIDVSMVIVRSGLRSPQDSNIAVRDQHPIVFVQIRICKTRCALIEPIQPIRKIPQPATT